LALAHKKVWKERRRGDRVALQLDGRDLTPSAISELKWRWRWKSIPGQSVYFERVVAFVRSDDPGPVAEDTLKNAQRSAGTGLSGATSGLDERWRYSDSRLKATRQHNRRSVRGLPSNSAANQTMNAFPSVLEL